MRVLTALIVAAAAVTAAAPPAAPPLLAAARQMVLVITPGWDDVHGTLRLFNASSGAAKWQPAGQPTAIVVGRAGVAWDPAIEPVIVGPVKKEGDGRSPAGVFALGTAFGFAPPADASWMKVPYRRVTEGIECVDDARSKVYNQIVDRRAIASPDWNSSEKMRDIGEPYRWGVVVEYNTRPATPNRGSCIFMHIGGGEGNKGTAGCTAMPDTDLRSVMQWLDPAASPVLVQLPQQAYEKVKGVWQLP